MKKFLQITKALVSKGDKFLAQQGNKSFHSYAGKLLEEVKLHERYDYQEIVTEAFEPTFNKTKQKFSNLEFSDLPITIARGKHCFIDLYFWRRRPTAIHNHHFSGAFQCLVGSNVDLEFIFTPKRKLGRHHTLGKVKLHETHEVRAGDIQLIAPMNKFIHQNHHHADLSVNLCFRTLDINKGCISNYLSSGLKYDKDPVLLQRAERLFRMIHMDELDYRKLNLTIDDALCFLIQSFHCTSQHKKFLELQSWLIQRVKKEARLDIWKLLEQDEQRLEQILEEYN